MALSLAESATKPLLLKLGSILEEEIGLLAEVKNDMQYIMDELKSMDSFLRVLSSRQDHDEQVKTWMEQVREMAYDAEDCIDVFKHRLGRSRNEQYGFIGFLTHTFRLLRTLKARHCIATDLQNLKIRARDVSERRARYSLASGTISRGASSSSRAPNSSDPLFVEEMKPVGIDARRDELIGWLKKENQHQLRVISILGFGGLGKTTLAMMIYQSPAITSGHFQACAWISVSQSYKIEALLRNMIKQLTISEEEIKQVIGDPSKQSRKVEMEQLLDKMEEMQLLRTIINHLQGKRYLIVIDDMWAISAWDRIKLALPDQRNGSRVIVTTRIETVANACCSRNHHLIYRIPPLKDDQSWELFCKRVFDGPRYSCPENLINLSELILRKCGGLPLAIVTIAGLLAAKPNKTPEEWQKLHDHLGTELESNPSLEGIKQVLTLSYNDLPYHLKPCFLYLSIFPEDCEISGKHLVKRWMAEGLVRGRRGMSDEEVATDYFNELISRSLIQPSRINDDGKVKACRVHDIMLEVIVSISMEKNFITVLDEHSTANLHGKIRRLALHQTSTLKHDLCLSQVRSLTAFGNDIPLNDYGKVKLLRVLDLQGCKGISNHHLKNISQLFLLNFLSLRNTNVDELPGSIGNLQNLRTLDIRDTPMRQLPNAAVKLQRLACLLVGAKFHFENDRFRFSSFWYREILRLPKRLGKMKGLQNLGQVTVTDSCMLLEIGELTQLKKLSIYFPDEYEPSTLDNLLSQLKQLSCYFHQEDERSIRSHNHAPNIHYYLQEAHIKAEHLNASLAKLSSCLRSLTLIDKGHKVINVLHELSSPPLHLQKMHLYGIMESLPTWYVSLKHIAKITLRYTLLDNNAIQVLKILPSLVQLTLGYYSFYGGEEQVCFNCEGFVGLKLLQIESLGVCFQEGALPNVEILKLIGCFDDEKVSGMQHLQKLKEVYLDIDNVQLQDMLRRTAEAHSNHPKICCKEAEQF